MNFQLKVLNADMYPSLTHCCGGCRRLVDRKKKFAGREIDIGTDRLCAEL